MTRRICAFCGAPLPEPRRRDRRTCSATCRKRLWRFIHAAPAARVAQPLNSDRELAAWLGFEDEQ